MGLRIEARLESAGTSNAMQIPSKMGTALVARISSFCDDEDSKVRGNAPPPRL